MRFAQMLMNNRRVLVNVSPESRNKPRGWGETSPGGGEELEQRPAGPGQMRFSHALGRGSGFEDKITAWCIRGKGW